MFQSLFGLTPKSWLQIKTSVQRQVSDHALSHRILIREIHISQTSRNRLQNMPLYTHLFTVFLKLFMNALQCL